MQLIINRTIRINLVMAAIAILFPVLALAQVNPGDILTADLTLTGNLDASTYGGSALRVGANNITIDGAGFSITVNGNDAGIDLSIHSFVTIKMKAEAKRG